MNLVQQEVVFTFENARYKEGADQKTYKNVKLDASAEAIKAVGQAISDLQGDGFGKVTLMQHQELA
ncbi:DUF1659 domain-containing protein [Lactobacillus corticis]|uniref:DUF1659 domain-containing protein n=1 Tax=Lactobacillus corticis TaxID=2201249 RepID=A0A916QKC1_9LACO|nr:DUF1659 domain-containing protein [Lactobacillus corticis]GFZ27438.1 hypothetical protein LCB40_13180 [Lactobacillus corticis]